MDPKIEKESLLSLVMWKRAWEEITQTEEVQTEEVEQIKMLKYQHLKNKQN